MPVWRTRTSRAGGCARPVRLRRAHRVREHHHRRGRPGLRLRRGAGRLHLCALRQPPRLGLPVLLDGSTRATPGTCCCADWLAARASPSRSRDHPCTFATLTAPSFGLVHGIRQKGPCRARRDKPVCPHGRPAWCNKRHAEDDPQVGQPLCLRVLRLHRPRGLAVARPRAVAPLRHRPATRPGQTLRPVGGEVPQAVQDRLLQGGRVPGSRRDPPPRPDPPRRPRRTRRPRHPTCH